MARIAALLLLVSGLISASYLVRLDINLAERNAAITDALPVYKDLGTSLILPLSESQLASLSARGWLVEVLDTDLSPGDYFIIYKTGPGTNWGPAWEPEYNRQGRQERQAYTEHASPPGRLLWENDRLRLVRLPELDARALKAAGLRIVQLPLGAHPLPAPPAPCSSPLFSYDTTVARIVSLVSQDSLVRTIQDLEDFGTRYSYNLKCESAAFYLVQRLTDLGYSVRLDTYYLTQPTTRAFNVEATLEGLAAPESILVACAHFDSYNGSNQNDAPGADDNATGTAAVIELARVLKQAQFRWSVKFLCFSGEEQWMKGSYHWVDSTAVPQNLKIAGAYNLDMFGYAAYDTDLVFINTNTASRSLANLCDSTNGWYSVGLRVMNYLDEDVYGDNTPFWEAGYLSVFALEDSEYGIWGGSNPHYHTDHDTFGILTMSLVTRTTRMTAACIATLAGPYYSVGVAESHKPQASSRKPEATVIRGVLLMPGERGPGTEVRAALLDVAGRDVMRVKPGPNDVNALAPGIYFIRAGDAVFRRVVKVR
jgi:hypothetical protein